MNAWTRFDEPDAFPLHLAATGEALCSVFFHDDTGAFLDHLKRRHSTARFERDAEHRVLREAVRQLEFYFRGQLREFDLPLDSGGTAFQRSVWSALRAIPYGETRSYRDVAREIGRPAAVRAVVAANGANPIPVIVPCHRVIASDGSLCGFGGGLEIKRKLLLLERQSTGLGL